MVAQSPPYAEQNAQHTASLFRLATFSAWREASGIVGPTDLAVTAQATPNMSVQVAAGRAWLKGTQVASVSGGTWSTQGAYFGYNDAPVTLTVAAADPTNPRIDAVVAYVTDAFYSGSTNTFVLGVVTGTPAASPAVPAVPSNGLLLATVAVAANATSIASGNISATAATGVPRNTPTPVPNQAARDALTARAGDKVFRQDLGVEQLYTTAFGWQTTTDAAGGLRLPREGFTLAPTYGSAAPASGDVMLKVSNYTGTTSAVGALAVPFASAFPNGVLTVLPVGVTNAVQVPLNGRASITKTGFTVVCFGPTGAALASTSVDISYVAVGW